MVSKKVLRTLTLALTVTCIGTMFVGCGNGKTSKTSTKSEERQKIRVVHYFTGDDPWTGTMKDVIEDFKSKNKNIDIVDEPTPSQGDAIRTKVKTDFASGTEPDVAFFFNGIDEQPLIQSGKLFVWDDELKSDSEWGNNFNKLGIDMCRAEDGKLYGLPYLGYYEGLLINKDLFEKNNVKIPTNWDEFLKAIDDFNAKKITPMAQSLKDPRYIWEYSTLSLGGAEAHDVKKPFDSSWEKALEVIKELYDKNAFPKDAMNITDEQAQALFRDGKAAMLINGSWAVGGANPDTTVVSYFPVIKDGKADTKDIIAGCGSGWYMSKELNEKKNGAPMKFIKYMTSVETMGKFAEVGGVPQIKVGDIKVSKAAKTGYDFVNGAKSSSKPTDGYLLPEAFNAINDGISYVVTGKKTASQLLDEAKAKNVK